MIIQSILSIFLSFSLSSAISDSHFIMPDAVCQNTTVYLNSSGGVFISPSDVDGGSTVPSGHILSISPSAFFCNNIGVNTVTLFVVNPMDQVVDMCTAEVTVLDTIPPVINCPSTVTAVLDANGQAVVSPFFSVTVSDNCGTPSFPINNVFLTCDDLGQTTVTYRTEDASGNADSCEVLIEVVDNLPPTLNCMTTTTAFLDNNGNAVVSPFFLVNFPIMDNCAPVSNPVLGTTFFTCNDIGNQMVTFNVDDNSGNNGTCNIAVNVVDQIPPVISCQDLSFVLSPGGSVSISPNQIESIPSTDNCAIASQTLDISSFDCSNQGVNPVVLTVVDVNNNVSTCTANVTISCTTLPVTYTTFTIKQIENSALLQWVTEAEINNDYFSVLHSTDGIQFTTIDKIQAKGNSPSNQYKYTHHTLSRGTNYYQLEQTDLNGETSLSKIVSIEPTFSGEHKITIYPNPSSEILNFNYIQNDQPISLDIYTQNGKEVYNGPLVHNLNVESWPRGLYIVKMVYGNTTQIEKIILN